MPEQLEPCSPLRVGEEIDRIFAEIRASVPAAPAAGSVSLEDVVRATARSAVPPLLTKIPLEIERLAGAVLDGTGEAGRAELLRLIIAGLAAEWRDLTDRLMNRMDSVFGSALSSALREQVERRFREQRTTALVLGTGPAAGRAAPPVVVAEELGRRVANEVARCVEGMLSSLGQGIGDHVRQALSAALAPLVPAIEEAAGRATATALSTRFPEDAEAIRALLRSEVRGALKGMSPPSIPSEEIQMIAAQIVHSLSASLSHLIFGPPVVKGEKPRVPRRRRPVPGKPRDRRPRAKAPLTRPALRKPSPKAPHGRGVRPAARKR